MDAGNLQSTEKLRDVVAELKPEADRLRNGGLDEIAKRTLERAYEIFETTKIAQLTGDNAAFAVGRMYETFKEYSDARLVLSKYDKSLAALKRIEEKA